MSRAPPGWEPPYGSGNRPPPQGQPQPPRGYGAGQRPPPGYGDPRMAQRGPAPSRQQYSEKPLGRPVPVSWAKIESRDQPLVIYNNLCAVSPADFPQNNDGSDPYILIRGGVAPREFVVTAKPIADFPPGHIGLSEPQRKWTGITRSEQFTAELYDPLAQGDKAYLGSVDLQIEFASPKQKNNYPYDEEELSKTFASKFQNQVLAPGQQILMEAPRTVFLITVQTVGLVDLAMSSDDSAKQISSENRARGILTSQTRVSLHKTSEELNLKPSMNKANANAILAPNFKFEDMGIGGLDKEFSTIFRRAFASRIFPPGMVANMGISHVKGMLLYGPPGTGKTLIARQIGKMLNARPPKVINGPEVLNKYVGQSEENIRKLFADAEKEYKEKGDDSGLHIIIFDELDAVCKQRGSGTGGGTGVGDSVVNQLLSKLDGVDQLNNILLIGMTNRMDMIDDALLRPGRLEVHVEISLPDEPGRLGIFKIHTAKMRENGLLAEDVSLEELASLTKNFSGAEINGLVKAAASQAFSRHTEVGQLAAVKQDVASMKVTRGDFMRSLEDVQAAYGVSEAELENAVRQGIIRYNPHIDVAIEETMRIIRMTQRDRNTFLSSVLFHGPKGSGKTALAAHTAMQSEFPFVKMVTPANLAGYRDEFAKKDYLHKAFTDAYKSPSSILILDNFEQLIGWNPIGPRFSMTMLEILTTLIATEPPKGHRLLVFVTTSNHSALRMLEVDKAFDEVVPVPAVTNLQELGVVLHKSGLFSADPSKINAVLGQVQQRTGSDRVDIGIKAILRCVSGAREGSSEEDIVDTLADLLVKKIQSS